MKSEYAYKICLIGESGVGKTSLTIRLLTGKFDANVKQTLGAEIHVKYLNIEDLRVVLQAWDFGGEDEFKFLLPSYATGSNGAIFMFDIANADSLNDIETWHSLFKLKWDLEVPFLLVGGKSDLKDRREVKQEKAREIAKKYSMFDYIECSAKTGANVERVFETITRRMMRLAGVL